jgi:tetratricopeptide (TPR) repeat protein
VLDPGPGLHDAERALSFFLKAGDRIHEGFARYTIGFILWCLGAFERAEAELRHEVERAAPGAHSGVIARGLLALPLAERGALDEALREASRSLAESQAARDHMAEMGARFTRAYTLTLQKDYAAAEEDLRSALALSGLTPGDARAKLSEVRLAQGDAAEALKLAREAGAKGGGSSALGRFKAREVEAEVLLGAGERAAAQARLAEGRAEILALAARIEDEGLRASFLARGPFSARLLRLAEEEGAGARAGASTPGPTP